MTLGGLPLAFGKFQWPFHRSTSGADTYIVHGEMRLADGGPETLFAKLAASVTVTFAEIVPAMEQPYAESFIYNAVRKTVDFGQLEFIKSGNRQPVFVTTRFYSRWQKKFVFTETNDAERLQYLLSKVYWLSGVLGASKPVWIADPQDAQYLNTTEADLLRMASHEAGEGLMTVDGEFAAATPALMARAEEFKAAPRCGAELHQAAVQRVHARRWKQTCDWPSGQPHFAPFLRGRIVVGATPSARKRRREGFAFIFGR